MSTALAIRVEVLAGAWSHPEATPALGSLPGERAAALWGKKVGEPRSSPPYQAIRDPGGAAVSTALAIRVEVLAGAWSHPQATPARWRLPRECPAALGRKGPIREGRQGDLQR